SESPPPACSRGSRLEAAEAYNNVSPCLAPMSSSPNRPNIFAGPYLDRSSHLRDREDWLGVGGRAPHAQFVAVWQARNLLRRGDALGAVLLDAAHAAVRSAHPDQLTFLGMFRGHASFLVELEGEEPPDIHPDAEFRELRWFGALLTRDEARLMAYPRRT